MNYCQECQSEPVEEAGDYCPHCVNKLSKGRKPKRSCANKDLTDIGCWGLEELMPVPAGHTTNRMKFCAVCFEDAELPAMISVEEVACPECLRKMEESQKPAVNCANKGYSRLGLEELWNLEDQHSPVTGRG